MSTSVLPFGTQNARNPLIGSQDFAVLHVSVATLQDLTVALEESASPRLGMLRATVAHLISFFDASPEQITLEFVRKGLPDFRKYLEAKKYQKNSCRTYCNYVGLLLKEARGLGWKEIEPDIPKCWQAILAAFPLGRRRDIVKMAIGQGIEPEQMTEDGLYEICQKLADQDRACRHSNSILAEFRKTIRQAKLADQFPNLRIAIKEAYRIKLEAWPDGIRKEVEALLKWKQADFAPGRPREAKHSKATAKRLEDTFAYPNG
jgi:hypothetical protein